MLEANGMAMSPTSAPLANLWVEPTDEAAGRELLEEYSLGLSGRYDERAARAFAVQVARLLQPGSAALPTFGRLSHDEELFFALLVERYRLGDAAPLAPPWLAEVPLLARLVNEGRAEVQTVERLVMAIPNEPPRQKTNVSR